MLTILNNFLFEVTSNFYILFDSPIFNSILTVSILVLIGFIILSSGIGGRIIKGANDATAIGAGIATIYTAYQTASGGNNNNNKDDNKDDDEECEGHGLLPARVAVGLVGVVTGVESVFEELDGEFSENIYDGGEGKSEEGKDVEAEDREDAEHGECGGQSRCLAFL